MFNFSSDLVCGDCDWPAPCFSGSGHYQGMYCSRLPPLQFKCTPTTKCCFK